MTNQQFILALVILALAGALSAYIMVSDPMPYAHGAGVLLRDDLIRLSEP